MPSNLVIFLAIMAMAAIACVGVSLMASFVDRKEESCSKTRQIFDRRKR